MSTVRWRFSPSLSFARRMRRTDRSIRSSGRRPDFTAATIPRRAAARSGGMRITSAPASSARTAASPRSNMRSTAPMSIASVKTSPPNSISSRRREVRTAGARVAGTFAPVIPGTVMWAVMIAPSPESIARRKGRSSTESMRSRLTRITGSEMCESIPVSPWPGKCLAVAIAPWSWTPLTKAAPRRATCAGSSPIARTLMTGFSGLLFTSSTGAKGTWTPIARPSSAVTRPISYAIPGSPAAPSAISAGKRVAPPSQMLVGACSTASKRKPAPASRSEPIRSGRSERDWSQLSLAATSMGEPTEMMMPPTRCSSTSARARRPADDALGVKSPIRKGIISCATLSSRVREARVCSAQPRPSYQAAPGRAMR